MIVWYIALGSAIGGVSRFLVGAAVQQRAGMLFPVGTLVVNVSGSLLLGFIMRLALGTPAFTAEMRALLTAGFCGGYTTFSTFSFETAMLIEDGTYGRAAVYAVASTLLALAGTFAGFALARALLAAVRVD
jgi:CrcB protein